MPAALQLDYGPELARERIAERVRDKQHQAWNKAKRTGIAFVDPSRLLKLPHTKRARSYEVFGSLDRQFAAAGNRAAATEAVKRLRAFKAQYVRAFAAWTTGDRNAWFRIKQAVSPRRFSSSNLQFWLFPQPSKLRHLFEVDQATRRPMEAKRESPRRL